MMLQTTPLQRVLPIFLGVLVGFFVALVLSYFFFPLTGHIDPKFMATIVDTHHSIHSEMREANFYRFCLIGGVIGGFLGFYCARYIRSYGPIIIGIVALIPALNLALINMIKSASPGEFYTLADEALQSPFLAFASALPFMGVLLGTLFLAVNTSSRKLTFREYPALQVVLKRRVAVWFPYVAVLFCLIIVFAPRPTVSPELGLFDYHRPTFFVGPGLYQLAGEKLAPGKDFSVQYGLAQSFVSALFFADTYPRTISNLNMYNAWMKVFFFFCLFVFLRRLYQDTFTASVVVLSAAALQFISYEQPGGFYEATIGVPSVGVYRHTFVPLVWIFVLKYLEKPQQLISLILLASSLGISLFWINDTGIACLVCVVGIVSVTPGRVWYKNLIAALMIVVLSIAAFACIGVAVYGASFARVDYNEMLKYMRIFASGFASVKAHWSFAPLDLLMHIVSNVIIVVTIVYAYLHRANVPDRMLLMIAVFAAMVKLKFINQTAAQHFFGDGYPFLIVLGFWLLAILARFSRSWAGKCVVTLALLVLIYDPLDSYRGIHAGIRSYLNSTQTFQLPYFIRSPGEFIADLKQIKVSPDPMFAYAMPPEDRALIEKYSTPGQRVSLISANDAAYLLETKRAPGAPFVPMEDFMFVKDFEDFYQYALKQRYVFVDVRSLNSSLATALLSRFAIVQKAQYLLLLENVTVADGPFAGVDVREIQSNNALFLTEMLKGLPRK